MAQNYWRVIEAEMNKKKKTQQQMTHKHMTWTLTTCCLLRGGLKSLLFFWAVTLNPDDLLILTSARVVLDGEGWSSSPTELLHNMTSISVMQVKGWGGVKVAGRWSHTHTKFGGGGGVAVVWIEKLNNIVFIYKFKFVFINLSITLH